MNYIVTRNSNNEILSTRRASPSSLIADAVAMADSSEYAVVEVWGGNEHGPLGSYPISTWINGKRI